ncbi:MAG: hypothetical protein KF709_02590 [Gemmatimonadaceae bacterium]|nr:hypothetical protein [Gemmatimonadaceae bacterium]
MTLAIVLQAAAATAPGIHLEFATIVKWAAGGLATALMGVASFFLRELVTSVRTFRTNVAAEFKAVREDVAELDGKVDGVGEEVRIVKQEVHGADGKNGMKGDLRQTKELLIDHDRFLERLAEREGMKIERRRSE